MGPAAMAGLSALSAAYNGGLAQLLNGLDAAFDPLGIDLLFDTAAFFADVTANPAAFGFTNVTDSCLYTAPAACSSYLYFDNVHPTTAGHDLLALQFASALGYRSRAGHVRAARCRARRAVGVAEAGFRSIADSTGAGSAAEGFPQAASRC